MRGLKTFNVVNIKKGKKVILHACSTLCAALLLLAHERRLDRDRKLNIIQSKSLLV